MMTQTTFVSATFRLRWISGSARTTIVVSTAVISTPDMSTTMARPVRSARHRPRRNRWQQRPAVQSGGTSLS